MSNLLQIIFNGILIGGIYALMSQGLSLIFGVIGIINFAHGEFLMLSMYLTFWLFQLWGIDPYISIVIVTPLFFFFGFATQKVVFQHLIKAPHLSQIFAAFGLVIVFQNIALFFWKADYRMVKTGYSAATVHIGALNLSFPRIIVFIMATAVTLVLYLFLKRTYLGKAIRATALDPDAAALMGINPMMIYCIAFGIGGALCGVAGTLLVPIYYVFPTIGAYFVLIAFVVVVLGGLGNVFGAFFGGLLIGITEVLSGYFFTSSFKEGIYFLIFILVLLIRPSGIFGLGKT